MKSLNILLEDSAEKRNPNCCLVLASIQVIGPLRKKSPETSDHSE